MSKVRTYVVLVFAILVSFNSLSFAAIPGDANGNEKLDVADAIIILQTLSGLRPTQQASITMTAFSIANPQATGVIDEDAKTIAISVPYGTDTSSLVAIFTGTGANVTVNGIPQISGTTPNNFTSPVQYRVNSTDGSSAIYSVTVAIRAYNSLDITGITTTSGDGYVRIGWNRICDLTNKAYGVAIVRKEGLSGFYSVIGSVSIDQTSFIDKGLKPNTIYYYKLYTYISYEASDISPYTSEYQVSTSSSNITPNAPTNLIASAENGWAIHLSWTDNSDTEDGFTIERSADNIDFKLIANTYANETSFRDNYVLADTPYYYRVKAFNVFGTSPASSFANVTSPTITPTPLGGGIATNTTLTLANSPYLVNSHYTLAPGYTLTIEPGVHIRFAPSTTLEVRGHLEAAGTPNEPIIFTAADPTNSSKTSWEGIHVANNLGGNAIIQYAEISHSTSGIRVDRDQGTGPVNIYDSVFNTNSCAISNYSGSNFRVMVYRSNLMNNYIAVGDADKIIAYSIFQNNTYGIASSRYPGIYGAERMKLYYNLFSGNDIALWGGNDTEVKYSLIQSNNIGVKPHFVNMSLYYNTIANNNDKGVIVSSYDTFTATIHNNNIFGNVNYNVVNTDAASLDLTSNWWGTTSSGEIDDKLFEFHDDAALGILHYVSILSTPVDTIP